MDENQIATIIKEMQRNNNYPGPEKLMKRMAMPNPEISRAEIKNISNLTWKQTEEEGTADSWLEEEEGLKGNDILVRQQLLDLYDDVKAKLEHKNCTLDQIFFTELQFSPHALCTVKGLSAAMEKLGIVVA